VDDPIENIRNKILRIKENRDNYKVMENITDALTMIYKTVEDGFLLVGNKIKDLYKKSEGLDKRILKIEKHKPKDGYTPVKGKDYFDGKDGYTPKKGVDYFDGKNGLNGRDGKDGVTKVITKEIDLDADKIKTRLESLTGEDRLDAKAIKNLPNGGVQRIGSGGFRKFKELEDTPKNFIGQASKLLAVKANEKGIEFVDASAGGVETDPVYTADKPDIALKSEIPEDVTDLTDTTEIIGNALKIQDFDVTTADPTDGKILVYRTAGSSYVLEDKPTDAGTPDASDIVFTPAGNISSTNVQSALEEVDTEKASNSFAIAMAVALG
jgi:hypothetical protein